MRFLICIFLILATVKFAQPQWIDQSYSSPQILYFDCSKFLNSNTGYLGETGKMFKTTNGGNNWSITSFSPVVSVTGFDFLNESTGFLVGIFNSTKQAFKTTNGGGNWTTVSYPVNRVFTAAKFISQTTLMCAGDSGTLIKSTNLGANWITIQTGLNQFLGPICVIDSLHFYVGSTNGTLLKTTNGGENWDFVSSGVTGVLVDLFFVNSNTGYALGNAPNVLRKTTNGGLFWSPLNMGVPMDAASNVFFPSVNTGYITANYNTGMGYQEMILKSSNGGTSWVNVATTNKRQPPRTSYFIHNDTGWVAGDGGLILKTTNGGLTYVSGNGEIISDFSLSQNYPNPFNPFTIINYQLTINSYVTLNIYDVNGKLIKILESGYKREGSYSIEFSGEGLSSGIYYYSLFADGVLMNTKKAILLK